MISSIAFFEISKIYYRENHIYDLGNVNVKKEMQDKERKKRHLAGEKRGILVNCLTHHICNSSVFVITKIPNRSENITIVVVYAITLLIQIHAFH